MPNRVKKANKFLARWFIVYLQIKNAFKSFHVLSLNTFGSRYYIKDIIFVYTGV